MPDTQDPFARLRELSQPGVLLDPEVLAKVLEVLSDAVIVVNEAGTIVYVNHAATLMFGYVEQGMVGHQIEMLLPADVHDAHVQHRTGFFRAPRTRPMGFGHPLRGRHKNGTELSLNVRLAPIVTVDGTFAIAVARDAEVPTSVSGHGP
jgi:protein-histidine pros-kinase